MCGPKVVPAIAASYAHYHEDRYFCDRRLHAQMNAVLPQEPGEEEDERQVQERERQPAETRLERIEEDPHVAARETLRDDIKIEEARNEVKRDGIEPHPDEGLTPGVSFPDLDDEVK